VHLVVSPLQLVAADLEGNTLGLGDINGLQAVVDVSVADEIGQVVVLLERHSSALTVDVANIDAKNLLGLGIGDHAEVKRVGVLVVELGVTVVGETLLETTLVAPALVNTNGPGIEEDLGHIGNANFLAGTDDAGISASNALHNIQILESEGGHDLGNVLPQLDLLGFQVDNNLGDLLCLDLNDNGESAAIGSGDLTSLEGLVLGLAGFPQSKAVELDSPGASMLADERSGLWDFHDGKLVKRVGSSLREHGSRSNAVIVSLPEDCVTRDGGGIRGRSHGVE
jgi:hypothetical protein